MKKILVLFVMTLLLCFGTALAGDQDANSGMDMGGGTMDKMETVKDMDKAMDSAMDMDTGSMDPFRHNETVDGIRAEFQVMSLAGMNMTDPEGNTHHIMVKFMHEKMDHQITNVTGKIKVISPSGKEQVASLKNYSGIYAGNFTFDEKGKYGVICLFKESDTKHTVKFWYDHM